MQDFTRMPTTTLASDTEHARVAHGAVALMRRPRGGAWDPHRLSVLCESALLAEDNLESWHSTPGARILAYVLITKWRCRQFRSPLTVTGHSYISTARTEEAGSRFKRLFLRNKLLVECAVEDHDGQVAQDKNGARGLGAG